MKRIAIITLLAALTLAIALPASAGSLRRAVHLDRKGDRIERKLDRAAHRAAKNGHVRRAAHLAQKGNRIDRRLDRKAARVLLR
ncbi:hypothetical protein [Salidesulfovibrio brasiliensis]|uniref:hypothetical protein n=1 Tax=Salidesulfovibrio brasiliensis TaxID=221711 RepID=UPI0006D0B1D1|nr:hypothetical protein [Salidesulfovibrio brasiliensis]